MRLQIESSKGSRVSGSDDSAGVYAGNPRGVCKIAGIKYKQKKNKNKRKKTRSMWNSPTTGRPSWLRYFTIAKVVTHLRRVKRQQRTAQTADSSKRNMYRYTRALMYYALQIQFVDSVASVRTRRGHRLTNLHCLISELPVFRLLRILSSIYFLFIQSIMHISLLIYISIVKYSNLGVLYYGKNREKWEVFFDVISGEIAGGQKKYLWFVLSGKEYND